jgi:hypothetical protein
MYSQRLGLRADSEELPRAYLRRALFVLSSGIRRESFTEIVRCRSRVDEGRERGKCNSSDENRELSDAAFHLIGGCAIAVPDPNVLRKQIDTLCKQLSGPGVTKKLPKKGASRALKSGSINLREYALAT